MSSLNDTIARIEKRLDRYVDITTRPAFILIVDDEKRDVELIKHHAEEKWNCVIDSVESGQEALDLLHIKAFDVIMLDIRMCEMNGIEVFRRLRKLDDETPVVFITGALNEEIVHAVKKIDLAFMMWKPDVFDSRSVGKIMKLLRVQKLPPKAEEEKPEPFVPDAAVNTKCVNWFMRLWNKFFAHEK